LSAAVFSGVAIFTVNFLIVKGEESEKLMESFYERLSPFSEGHKVLESIEGSGFKPQECWALNDQSIELILRETSGDLFSDNILYLPEDWLFYREDSIFLQIVSHVHEATLRVAAAEYEQFQSLGITHKLGLAQYTGLPERPCRG
jgi:hypothetical protein